MNKLFKNLVLQIVWWLLMLKVEIDYETGGKSTLEQMQK